MTAGFGAAQMAEQSKGLHEKLARRYPERKRKVLGARDEERVVQYRSWVESLVPHTEKKN